MPLIILLLSYFTFTACTTYTDETQSIHSDFINQNYTEAYSKLEQSGLKKSHTNRLLYHLEKSLILDRMDKLGDSRQSLFKAASIVDELYTVSLSKTAATLIYNESAQDYSGEIFEQVAIHTLLALSFLQDNMLKKARIEAKQINHKLYAITQEYGTKNNSYTEDAFALYLSGIIYDALGNIDDAIIDYRRALSLYQSPGYRHFFTGKVAQQIGQALFRLAHIRKRHDILKELNTFKFELETNQNQGEIIVIHEIGHILRKQAHDFMIPIDNQLIRFSFPYINLKQSPHYLSTGFRLNGKPFTNAVNVANMNAIAHHTLEERRFRLIAKGVARLLLKAQLTSTAHEELGPLGGLLANAYSAVTETADTRSWSLLPSAFFVSRLTVPPGRHSLTITNNGKISNIRQIVVQAGQRHIVRSKQQ